MKYRYPAVAGSFYPNDPIQLKQTLSQLMADKPSADKPSADKRPKALIVPHAGYIYSGKVAAYAYAYLAQNAANIRRVVLLGPSHRYPLRGCAVPSADIFVTPLGNIPIDVNNCARLRQLGLAQQLDQAHEQEHSLEVQLPFLQHCLTHFELLPIAVGAAKPDSIAKVISLFAEMANTIIIISTDLSHFHSYPQACTLDAQTIDKIERCNPTLTPEDACGCFAVNGILKLSQTLGWHPQLLNQANSGDINHSKNEVVGYASFVLY